MLLIHPPMTRACEPPAGIARLAGALRARGHRCSLWDANLEGQLQLLTDSYEPDDTWSRRACKNIRQSLAALRSPATFTNLDRYQRAVADCNRVLALAGGQAGITLSLTNYQPTNGSAWTIDMLSELARDFGNNLFYPWFADRIDGIIQEQQPRLIGFSLNYRSQLATTLAMAGFIRAHWPEIKLVTGGGLVTSWLRGQQGTNPLAALLDHCIAGPGEAALLLLAGDRNPVPQVPPDYTDLPLANYLAPGLVLPYTASAGCYWKRCTFCPEKAEATPYRPLPRQQVCRDLRGLTTRLQPSLIHLLDSALSPALLSALVDNPPGRPWYGFVRVERMLAEPAFCAALARSGCRMLQLGIESGDQAVLDATDKGTVVAHIEATLAALSGAGIATYVYLLFGTPAEDEAAARRTMAFVLRNRQAIDFLNLAVFNMPINSPEASRYGIEPQRTDPLSLYTDFRHPLGWSRRRVRHFLDREFTRVPEIAAIIRRDPASFTSNHAPFFSRRRQ